MADTRSDEKNKPHQLNSSQFYGNESLPRYKNSPHQDQAAPYEHDNLSYRNAIDHEYSELSFSGRYDYPNFSFLGPITGQPGRVQQMEFDSSKTPAGTKQTSPHSARQWNTGLCDCCKNKTSCCAVAWCAPFYLCYLSNKIGEHCCLPLAIPCGFYSLIPLRTKIRTEHNIAGSVCEDCCMACWCPLCSMCQMSREQDFVKMNPQAK